MTIRARFFSTIFTAIIAVCAVVIVLSSSAQRGNMLQVYANQHMNVAIDVSLTNAGSEVEIENHSLSTIGANSAIELEDQAFRGPGLKNAICYTIAATNNESHNVSTHFNEINADDLDNLDVIHEYTIIRGEEHIDTANDAVILPGDTLIVSVSVYVVDGSRDANSDITLTMNLSAA